MAKSLTESVARLHRAGSEHSQEATKLREAADALLGWINENAQDVNLPFGCKFYSIGQLTHPRDGIPDFQITRGQQHTREQLLYFSKLIADGFLDELRKTLRSEARGFRGVAERITSFLQPA